MRGTGEPGYLHTARGSLFTLRHPPERPCQGVILHLPAFTEELNTCRRVSAQAARHFASQGWWVWQFDPTGCGDSAGDMAQASWQDWVQDAQAVLQHALREPDLPEQAPICLWGIRAGALLCADVLPAAQALAGQRPVHLVWWQPQLHGKQILQQWLRVGSAQAWLGQTQGTGADAAGALARGESVCVGGYTLSASLAADLNAARSVTPPPSHECARLVWLDVQASAEPSPGNARLLDTWQSQGWQAQWEPVNGPLFWQAPGREDAPALAESSLRLLGHPSA